jgi:hypothetical protein
MNVNGLPSSLQSLLSAREQLQTTRPDATGTTAAQAQRAAAPATVAAAQAKPAAANAVMSAQAPEGTDPALWSVLTSDERAFFSRVVTSGPLTYSKMAAASANRATTMPAIRGGRIDFRA